MDTRSNQRPKSAVQSQRLSSQSLGKFLQNGSQGIDEKTVSMIWRALGSYIAKQMKNGKGVAIPKFGQFTFTAAMLDLAGTTNPQQRDHQHRVPVFIVGKDFISLVPVRTGIVNQGTMNLRPYENKGSSGIIPKCKINYFEVASYCNVSKDMARDACEQVYRFLSDKIRKSNGTEQVQIELPFIGYFIFRSGVCGFAFSDSFIRDCLGQTAKSHTSNNLFSNSNNRLNMQIHDQNQNKVNPSFGLGGALKVTQDAEFWLKNNLNISVQDVITNKNNESERYSLRVQSAKPNQFKQLNRYGSLKPEDLKRKSWNLNNMMYSSTNTLNQKDLTEQNKNQFDRMSMGNTQINQQKRPMSAVTRITQNSRITNIPEVSSMKLSIIANDIYRLKARIVDYLQTNNKNLREILSSSQFQQIFKKIGLSMDIGLIKALLKDLGYNWNGPACTIVELLQKLKQYLNIKHEQDELGIFGQGQQKDRNVISYQSERQNNRGGNMTKSNEQLIEIVKDLFYFSGKTLFQLYNEMKVGNEIDYQSFRNLIQQLALDVQINDQEMKSLFQQCSKNRDTISYKEFERIFKWEVPQGYQWETATIRKLREWMYKHNLNSDTAFEHFCKISGKQLAKKINRMDFHKSIQSISELSNQLKGIEIDQLFKILDLNRDGELDADEWGNKIYEDSLNPLQMLREVVSQNRLTADDLLFKMHMRMWDDPMDFPKFCEVVRRLDATLSEFQLKHLSKVLKNPHTNKIEVNTLLRNLCGQEHETVDFRNRMYKKFYQVIQDNGKEEEMLQLLEDADPLNDGRVEPQGLKFALRKVMKGSVDEEDVDRFVRFLDKDKAGKIDYMGFFNKMNDTSNRDHNPFKSVVQRLRYFLETNKQTIHSLLKRLSIRKDDGMSQTQDGGQVVLGVRVNIFADFLKQKIDKKRDYGDLRQYAHKMDVDKDGLISEIDLETCLNNLNLDTFYKNSGEALQGTAFSSAKKFFPSAAKALSEERAMDIAKQIRTSLINQKIAYREAFNRFDANKDGLLNFQEFSDGLDKIIKFSVPIKEKLFALMDKNQIGLVDYPNFLEIIQLTSAKRVQSNNYNDSFDWENQTIDKIRDWIHEKRITVEEAFKAFDSDFDGKISKNDLKSSLIDILKIPQEEIYQTRLDRLFRLMDFYKTGKGIQQSDFQRLIVNENPYSTQGSRMTPSTESFRRSFGGGFTQTSTFDWKLSAIQQIGLTISKKFKNVRESFEVASEHMQKVTFDQFKKFIEQNQALLGFNLTHGLIQKLFSEIDPHKKGYLAENDWMNAFQSFNWNDQIYLEMKDSVQCAFSNCESAFQYFLSHGQQNQRSIDQNTFIKALQSLTSNRFNNQEIQMLWKAATNGTGQPIDQYHFRSHFENLNYCGKCTVSSLKNQSKILSPNQQLPRSTPIGTKGAGATTIYSQTSSSSQWDTDIFEKLRQIIQTSSKSLEEIFNEMDTDKNGSLSQNEFRHAIRKLNLGISSQEIDNLMKKIDSNQDGKIDWQEFCAKFKPNDLDERLKTRAKNKMGKMKEMMILHMISPNDAFRMFDESKLGRLSYSEFSKLVIELHKLAKQPQPTYTIIKDLFDTVDVRKDGIIDVNEWQQTFGKVVDGDAQMSFKGTPLTMWESNSAECQKLGKFIAQNRKVLKSELERKISEKGHADGGLTFDDCKDVIEKGLQNQYKNGIGDDKIKVILQPAEVQGSQAQGTVLYDCKKLFDIYKNRFAAPQS